MPLPASGPVQAGPPETNDARALLALLEQASNTGSWLLELGSGELQLSA
ncbi:MAG: hypothetical protein JWQ72_2996, partial [Polaromonas sp.]|nr:hypothetical protein [Polaromonas sp.]